MTNYESDYANEKGYWIQVSGSEKGENFIALGAPHRHPTK